MPSFFKLKKSEDVLRLIEQFGPSGEETVPLEYALGRVVSRDVISQEDLPHFFRSVVDGYAVRSRDTFGASESLPALLTISGEILMGRQSPSGLSQGHAFRIATGGMLPENADGVVMIEHCHLLDEQTLEVSRAISPLENVIQPGDDFKKGGTVFKRGHKLRVQDLGLLAGLGRRQIRVYRKPRVAIISTGDEIVSVSEHPGPGQVRDINRYTLAAFCRSVGAEPVNAGRCPDHFEDLKTRLHKSLARAETVWISGGSSVGTRDLTLKVFETLQDFELLVHGISISPGKPTIIGKSGTKPVVGLPGHVASALVVADVFMGPLIQCLSGRTRSPENFQLEVEAVLSRNVESATGREDYVRVKLVHQKDVLVARPVFGKSGLISTLVESDGLIRIDLNTEGLYEGQKVKVRLSPHLSSSV
ncbi:MAG: molybdopterin molybdenumtransferase MoeA [Deltaproteobacteria bacterium]|nr:MAG: molybdopterin molybdenumtransferase MoeA [Deltaproteobacteria bacterium]